MTSLGHPHLILLEDWRRYRLAAPWAYRWRDDSDGRLREITIPAGFTTDLASVPRLLHTIISPYDLRHASLPHDLIYSYAGRVPARYFTIDGEGCETPWTRRDADRLFARIMREAGVSMWRRRAAYRAVRVAGWRRWRVASKADVAVLLAVDLAGEDLDD